MAHLLAAIAGIRKPVGDALHPDIFDCRVLGGKIPRREGTNAAEFKRLPTRSKPRLRVLISERAEVK